MNETGGPPETSLTEDFGGELATRPADERVYRVALQLTDPTRVAEVAELADCAQDTARRHLRRLVDIGVLERIAENPDAFARNESYFEWRERNRLAELSDGELRERLAALSDRARTYRERYDADDPGAVDALEHATHEDVEDVWLDLSEWETVRDRIERLEAVRRRRRGETGVA